MKQREAQRMQSAAQRDAEAERIRKEREDAMARGEAAKRADEEAFKARQVCFYFLFVFLSKKN